MHSEDGDEDVKASTQYGIAPMVVGVLGAAALIWLMFSLADGFS